MSDFISAYSSRSSKTRVSLYPDRFFSLSDYYLPPDVKSLFRWCEYFFMKDPLVGSACHKMAAYPVTDPTYSTDAESPEIKEKWRTIMEDQLDVRGQMIRNGLNYLVFGNAFVSVYYPFTRYLVCGSCKKKVDISNTDHYDSHWSLRMSGANGYEFTLKCPQCGAEGPSDVRDVNSKHLEGINFIEWDPKNIDIEYYQVTGKKIYYYNIPRNERDKIRSGKDKYYIKTLPLVYIEATAKDKVVELNSSNLFHWSRYSLAGRYAAWGKPLILHSLQKLFYHYTLLRAQEAIATEKIMPFDLIFPTSTTGQPTTDYLNFNTFTSRMQDELSSHRKDPNYTAVLPEPVGHIRLGGDGRMMLLGAELELNAQDVTAGMGVPKEFVYGGLSWTGSSISLRILENTLQGHRRDCIRFGNFVTEAVRRVKDLPKCKFGMTELKMADDINRLQIMMQLNTQNKISDETFLAQVGVNPYQEAEKIEREMKVRAKLSGIDMLETATAQGEAMVINAEYQSKSTIAGTRVNNLAMNDLDSSLPVIQREKKRINDLVELKMLNLQLLQTQLQEMQMNQQIQQGGAPPPEQSEGGGSSGEQPPAEGGGGGEPQEQGASGGQAATSEEMNYNSNPAETPVVNNNSYSNPYYQGQAGPDVERNAKIWATKLGQMPLGQRQQVLNEITKKMPSMAQRIKTYIANTPTGGTSSDADAAMRMRGK